MWVLFFTFVFIKRPILYPILGLLLVLPFFGVSQKLEGIPFITNYSPKEYKSSPENWAIAQDKRGVMYFGNGSNVLEYDGVNWRRIEASNNSVIRSLAIDSSGIVYVGAVGEFGFLRPDSKGVMTYCSLVSWLPENEREFADVWKTYATNEGVYFQTFSKLIRIHKGVVKIWKPETSFHFSFYVNGKLYINERQKGLRRLDGENLVPIERGEVTASIRIYGMVPLHNKTILLATREKGLMLYDPNTINKDSVFTYLPSQINQYLINAQVYGVAKLNGDRMAFATLKQGAFITDLKGNIQQTLNKEVGLQDDIIKYAATDRQGDLWLALGNGIARVEISSPLYGFGGAHGLSGFIQDITKYKEHLYVATSLGVFAGSNEHFEPVKGIAAQAWSLCKVWLERDTMLLASSEGGVFQLNGINANLVQPGFGYFLYQSHKDPRRIFVGMNDGLLSLRYENKKWISEDYFNGLESEIRSITEDSKGNLWLGTPFDGLIQITFIDKPSKADTLTSAWGATYRIRYFNDSTSGLPDSKYNIPYRYRDKVIFATTKGFYQYNEQDISFSKSPFLRDEMSERQVYRLASNDSTAIWMVTVLPGGKKETGFALKQPSGAYLWQSKPFLKISDREIHAVFPEENKITWFGGPDGLLHYDGKVNKDFSQSYHALIRMVIAGSDSIFAGTYFQIQDSIRFPRLDQPETMRSEIKFENNFLQFEFCAAYFGDERNSMFSIYLQGYDTTWSPWNSKTSKEYTNLKEGAYIFRVKSKNIYGTESTEATYAFTILPPWYRTTWAYVSYALGFIGFVYLIIRISVRRLVKAKVKLEGIVKERTAEIESQKHLIEEKQKEIIDSINYAQRIQRALLASDKLLIDNLAQHFVFFQPKDIVSGDFYWATKLINGQFALVTADSTGHGVPGAIMSMLNISCLNEATTAQRLNDPNEILNYARAKIIGHLANDGSAEGGKDGMDCSLISFDFAAKKITYAAANNPVWIVRDKQIIELSPDKMPVGKHDRDKEPFAQHTIDMKTGDVVYTITDGMPDQFGGPKGKKFMYKQLKDLFISVSNLDMSAQKDVIKNALNDWKGELEQVDDVCIIGVRI